jgi:hypothetical protein
MKTAMQELAYKLEKLAIIREQEGSACAGIYNTIRHLANSMLEKEKEQIIKAHIDGQVEGTLMGGPGPAEYYYQETFNTKEK